VRPFVFGTQEMLPASDMSFKKTENLALFFQVYNAGLDQTGKPNLTLEYEFYRVEAGAEKFFNKTNPQQVNGTNLPPQFDPAKYPVPGGIEVPLASFGEGQYRLGIKITDKAAGKTLTRDVKFTVTAS
jgi:heme-binding NEAT domain protein